MFVGLLLIGSIVGAVSGLTAFILGSSVWMAFLIYSGVGTLSALTGALAMVLRPEAGSQTETAIPHELAPPQRG